MKLCWDNIENIRLSKFGNFIDIERKITYKYIESCEHCNDPFISKNKNSKYCSYVCARKDYKMPIDQRKKIGESLKGRKKSDETKKKMKEANIGKKHTEESKKKISISKSGRNHPNYGKPLLEETRRKISESNMGRRGLKNKNPMYEKDGYGYYTNGIPVYDTYAHQLEWAEEVRRNKKDPNILEVRCFKCDKWYMPTLVNTQNRLQYLKNTRRGEQRFYCSEECKKSCSIFNKSPEQVMKEDAVRAGRLPWLELKREVQPELRQMVLERDGHKCIKCGSKENLQCHHILPVSIEPLFSADVDNCIILCYTCHKKVHQEVDGCGYKQLQQETCL